MGVLSLAAFVYVDIFSSSFNEYLFIPALFLFCVLVMLDEFWQKIFSLRFFTVVGGMCYSIYLWHDNIISFIGNKAITFHAFRSYPYELLWQLAILLPAILFFSTCFYLLIERPCMDKDWPVKLWNFIKTRLFNLRNNAKIQ